MTVPLLRKGLTAFVRTSPAMESLDQAMRLLYRDLPRPSVGSLAELVLLSIVREHEVRTQGVLGRLNRALAQVLDDLDALRAGRSIEGRTAGLRIQDLSTIAQAMEELRTLEQQVRLMLDSDPSWAGKLRTALSRDLAGPKPPVRRPATFHPAEKTQTRKSAPGIPKVGSATGKLRRALRRAGPDPAAVVASGRPPNSVLRAADQLVETAGGVAEAVEALHHSGTGPETDAMIIAVLVAEGRLYQGVSLPEGRAWAAYQQAFSGLTFEWASGLGPRKSRTRPPDPTLPARKAVPPGIPGGEIGIDDIKEAFLVDMKSGATPLEVLQRWADAEPRWLRDEERGVDARIAAATRRASDIESQLVEYEHKLLRQLMIQAEFASENGLRGVCWICSGEEVAASMRLLADRLPSRYRGMDFRFVVGGMR